MEKVKFKVNGYLSHLITVYMNDESTYMEIIKKRPNGFTSPVPVSKEVLKELTMNVKLMSNKDFTYEFDNMRNLIKFDLKGDSIKATWILKARKQRLLFSQSFKIKELRLKLPDLCFHYGNSLSLYVTNKFPYSKENIFYELPLPNMSSSGSVCLGLNEDFSKIKNINDFMQSVEGAYFNSEFTHWSGLSYEDTEELFDKIIKEKKISLSDLIVSKFKL